MKVIIGFLYLESAKAKLETPALRPGLNRRIETGFSPDTSVI